MLTIALTGSVLGTVFRYGLGGKAITSLFLAAGEASPPDSYKAEWEYSTQRCGLKEMDVVFLCFVGLNLIALGACAASILTNVYPKQGADIGSSILALSSMLLLPLAAFWVFTGYFTNFPKELPAHLKGKKGYVKPSPWPFGSERLAWILITVTSAFWLFLLQQVLSSSLPGFPG